jgi:hypothetical protein
MDPDPRLVYFPKLWKGTVWPRSVVACVETTDESMIPFVMRFQDSNAVIQSFKELGLKFGVDLIFKGCVKRYMNFKLFSEYIQTVLILHIKKVWENAQCEGKHAIIMMDNCLSHGRKDMTHCLWENRVKVLAFARILGKSFRYWTSLYSVSSSACSNAICYSMTLIRSKNLCT